MTQALIAEYFREPRFIGSLPNGANRLSYADSCNVHYDIDELQEDIEAISTELYILTPNCTAKIQPLNQLSIHSIKAEWKKR